MHTQTCGIYKVRFHWIFVIVSSDPAQYFGVRLVECGLIESSEISDDLLMKVGVKYLSARVGALSELWLQCSSTVLELDPKGNFQTEIL